MEQILVAKFMTDESAVYFQRSTKVKGTYRMPSSVKLPFLPLSTRNKKGVKVF